MSLHIFNINAFITALISFNYKSCAIETSCNLCMFLCISVLSSIIEQGHYSTSECYHIDSADYRNLWLDINLSKENSPLPKLISFLGGCYLKLISAHEAKMHDVMYNSDLWIM